MQERDKNGHLKAGIRLPGWDYSKPWFYMITLTVKERRPILGEIKDGKMIGSPLGEAVAAAWKNIGNVFKEVEPCQYAVMPEHFHGIIWVHEQLGVPLGEVIRSFKIACTKANGGNTFWFPGFYDTILFSKGQLKHMTHYVLRNAERRWAVMQNPDLFKITRGIELESLISGVLPGAVSAPNGVPPGAVSAPNGVPPSAVSALLPPTCDAVGNHFLLDSPNKLLIQISRSATLDEINAITEKALLHGNRGGVTVSGCISPGEQAVAQTIREAGLPLIAIIPRGFGPYFKPSGVYFDACSAGRLLMLSPFPKIGKAEKLDRQRCFAINAIAAAICGDDPASITYHGSKPGC